MEKQCRECKEVKSFDDFPGHVRTKDKKSHKCNDCTKKSRIEIRQKKGQVSKDLSMKLCQKCKKDLPFKNFNKNKQTFDGYAAYCMNCRKISRKKKRDQQRVSDVTIIEKKCTKCNETKEVSQFYRENNNKDGYNSICKVCYKDKNKRLNRREYHAKYMRERRANDENFRILGNLRHRINLALKMNFKAAKTRELLGCSVSELWIHLETQFTDGMTKENYGQDGWEVDHIVPCDSFDLTNHEEQKKCFHFSNLQPLWKTENASKGNRW